MIYCDTSTTPGLLLHFRNHLFEARRRAFRVVRSASLADSEKAPQVQRSSMTDNAFVCLRFVAGGKGGLISCECEG